MKNTNFSLLRMAAIAVLLGIFAMPGGLILAQEANDPEYNFEFLWQTFDRNYALFQAKHIDWHALYRIYRPQVTARTTGDELFEIMSHLLGYLNDNHVRLTSSAPERYFGAGFLWDYFRGQGFSRLRTLLRQRPVPDKRFKAPLKESGNKIFAYGWLDDEIGYFHFNAFDDADGSARAIDGIMAEFEGARALVVDVRRNGGGDDRIGKLIADRFADRKRLYMTTQDRNGPGHGDMDPKRHFFVEPGGARRFTKTVILLINRLSISAAENFTLAMRILPHVTVVGDFTSGCFADNMSIRLPNGWNISLSKNLFLDQNGFCWEGIGVPPDLKVSVNYNPDEPDPETDPLLDTALALIRSGNPVPQDESANLRPCESLVNLLEHEIDEKGIGPAIDTFEARMDRTPDGIHYLDCFEMEALVKRLIASGRLEEGEQVLSLASRHFPGVSSVHEAAGWEYLRQNKRAMARASLEKAVELIKKRLSPMALHFYAYLLDSLVVTYLAESSGGLDRCYLDLRDQYPRQVSEETLNMLGNYLIYEKLTKPAIELLKLNAKYFPRSANAFASLGEAYLAAGNKRLAIRNYERSLKLDPKNENAATALKKLKSK